MNDSVTLTLDGTTAILRLDDGKANALTAPVITALLAALTEAEQTARALVFVGRPERFCAGFDLKTMLASPEAATTLLKQGAELYMRLYTSPLPIVIACTGHAMAGGALMLLTGDLRIGVAGPYRLGLNEVAIGMPLPVLGVELVRDRIVLAEQARVTMGAQVYDPAGAVVAGYLDEVVAADVLVARATAEATRLGALSRSAYNATKQRLRGGTVARIRETLEVDMAELAGLLPKA